MGSTRQNDIIDYVVLIVEKSENQGTGFVCKTQKNFKINFKLCKITLEYSGF